MEGIDMGVGPHQGMAGRVGPQHMFIGEDRVKTEALGSLGECANHPRIGADLDLGKHDSQVHDGFSPKPVRPGTCPEDRP